MAAAALLALVFLGSPRPPAIPTDRPHLTARSRDDCLSCHGPDGKAPRPPTHPLRDDCFSCHVWASPDD